MGNKASKPGAKASQAATVVTAHQKFKEGANNSSFKKEKHQENQSSNKNDQVSSVQSPSQPVETQLPPPPPVEKQESNINQESKLKEPESDIKSPLVPEIEKEVKSEDKIENVMLEDKEIKKTNEEDVMLEDKEIKKTNEEDVILEDKEIKKTNEEEEEIKLLPSIKKEDSIKKEKIEDEAVLLDPPVMLTGNKSLNSSTVIDVLLKDNEESNLTHGKSNLDTEVVMLAEAVTEEEQVLLEYPKPMQSEENETENDTNSKNDTNISAATAATGTEMTTTVENKSQQPMILANIKEEEMIEEKEIKEIKSVSICENEEEEFKNIIGLSVSNNTMTSNESVRGSVAVSELTTEDFQMDDKSSIHTQEYTEVPAMIQLHEEKSIVTEASASSSVKIENEESPKPGVLKETEPVEIVSEEKLILLGEPSEDPPNVTTTEDMTTVTIIKELVNDSIKNVIEDMKVEEVDKDPETVIQEEINVPVVVEVEEPVETQVAEVKEIPNDGEPEKEELLIEPEVSSNNIEVKMDEKFIEDNPKENNNINDDKEPIIGNAADGAEEEEEEEDTGAVVEGEESSSSATATGTSGTEDSYKNYNYRGHGGGGGGGGNRGGGRGRRGNWNNSEGYDNYRGRGRGRRGKGKGRKGRTVYTNTSHRGSN